MKLLLHVCCGPCACGAIPVWQQKGIELTGFFYNPNIHPLLEYRRRLEGAKETAAATGTALVVDESYDPEVWFAAVSGDEGSRCERCIGMRLDRAAQRGPGAGLRGLLHQPLHQSLAGPRGHPVQRRVGAAEKHGVAFVYEDLRAQYPESRRISRERGIYRQKYCGCLVSEWERYRDR